MQNFKNDLLSQRESNSIVKHSTAAEVDPKTPRSLFSAKRGNTFPTQNRKVRFFVVSFPTKIRFILAQETIDKLLNLADKGNWSWKDGKSRPPSPKRRRSPSPNEYVPVYNTGRLPPQFPAKRSRTDSVIDLSDSESIRSTKSSNRTFEYEKGIFLRAAPKDRIIDAEDAHAYQVKSEFLSSALGSNPLLHSRPKNQLKF